MAPWWLGAPQRGCSSHRATGANVLLALESLGCLPRTDSHYCAGAITFAWSPNSRTLLVGGVGPGEDELFLASVTTGRSRQAAHADPLNVYMPVGWEPDGHSFLYTRANNSPDQAACCAEDIREGSTVGAAAHVVYRIVPVGWPDEYGPPALSPNGRWLALRAGTSIRLVSVPAGTYHDLAGIHATDTLAWLPDSGQLAFLKVNSQNPFMDVAEIIPATGGHVDRVGAGVSLTWAPDGELLITGGRDSNEIWASVNSRPARVLFAISPNQNIDLIDPS